MYIYPHNNEWAAEYARESNEIISNYGKDLKLYHIGSTAVKGLFAKDCIDILGVVTKLAKVQAKKECLRGYSYKGEYGIRGRAYFSKTERKVHLHIFEKGDDNIAKHLNFVNVMSNRPELVIKLNKLKKDLQSQYPNDKDLYQMEKAYFYSEIHKICQ